MLHLTSGDSGVQYAKRDNPSRTCRSSCMTKPEADHDSYAFHIDGVHENAPGAVVAACWAGGGRWYLPSG